jgi:NTE family protein
MHRKRKLVGVALGSGGMRGIAHIGVLQVLEEANIPIDFVSGASVGAFVGAAYAAEMDLYALGRFATGLKKRDVLDFPSPFRSGVFSGKKFQKLCALVTDNRSFSETCVPFWCSAVDIGTGET